MFQFYWPWMALLLPLPFLIRKKKKESASLYFPSLERVQKAFSVGSLKASPSNWILFLAWVSIILALMQPEIVNAFKQVKNKGYDLMLAVDISGSMQSIDFSTTQKTMTRLDATKEVVGKFVRGRQGDRVGLITFGESAYMHVPLTVDTLSVSKMLNDTVSGMAGNATAIGDAIGLSVRTLRERPEGSRVLILLTDGEDNASSIPPLEAAKLAKQYGIKIYTIGVGRTQYGDFGMDEDLLREIATTTGGFYFRARDQKALESIYTRINKLEKSESNDTHFFVREPLYHYPLMVGVFCLFFISIQPFLRRVTYGS